MRGSTLLLLAVAACAVVSAVGRAWGLWFVLPGCFAEPRMLQQRDMGFVA